MSVIYEYLLVAIMHCFYFLFYQLITIQQPQKVFPEYYLSLNYFQRLELKV